jgi:DNA-binding LacI/PurR family transcriptional regulator
VAAKKKPSKTPKNSTNRPVNMQHIAKVAGVSIGTVSHVINGKVAVSASLRERVLEAIRLLEYQPSQMARGLRRNTTDMIGMIIPDITNPFFPAVVRGAEDIAYTGSFRLLLCNSDNDASKEAAYFNELRTFRPAGVIVIPSGGTTLLTQLRADDPPLIFVDRCPVGWKGDAVVTANESGAVKATQYLIEMGHRRLAMISGPAEFSNARERLEGFRQVIREANIMLPMEYLQEGEFTSRSGFACMKKLLEMNPRPSAVFVANDLMAAGALQAIRETGLTCPQDISLFGFDDLEFSSLMDPPLHTVHQPGYQMGSTAAQMLLERIQDTTRPTQTVLLETSLEIRGSVRRMRQRAGQEVKFW